MARRNDLSKPIHWRGRQWAVTGFGLETIGEPYHYSYEKARLAELNHDGSEFSVPRHITGKTWCDVEDFVEAFRQATRFHSIHFPTMPADWSAALDALIVRRAAERVRSAKIRAHLPDTELGIVTMGELDEAERKAFPNEKHDE